MCAAKTMTLLNRLAMRLHREGEHRAALVLLGLALRESLRRQSLLHEAKIRNNVALVLALSGRRRLAQRQLARALGLVARRVGCDNALFSLLQTNFHSVERVDLPRSGDNVRMCFDAGADDAKRRGQVLAA